MTPEWFGILFVAIFPAIMLFIAYISPLIFPIRFKDGYTYFGRRSNPITSGMTKDLAIPEPEPVRYEMYGHPAPPIALLGASLCQAPLGYGWEVTTVVNDDDNPALRLALLDLKTVTEVDAIQQDLVVVRKWKYADDDTYAAFYRRAHDIEDKKCENEYKVKCKQWADRHRYIYTYDVEKPPIKSTPDGKLAGRVMMANLITPMVDWAALLTLRYIAQNPDETKCNYLLIEAK